MHIIIGRQIVRDAPASVTLVYPLSCHTFSDLHFKLTDDKTSIFSARTVACGMVFTYLTVRLCDVRAHNGEASVGSLMTLVPPSVAVAAIITTVARVSPSLFIWEGFTAWHPYL